MAKGNVESAYACEKCGRDCKSKMALDKHQSICGLSIDHPDFVNRFNTQDRCPKCSQFGKSFYIKDPHTWVCMECGIHFTPTETMLRLRMQLAEIKWRRP